MESLRDTLDRHLTRNPVLAASVYIAKSAVVLGDVRLGEHSSVWHHAVVRGDIQSIEIGHHTNLQDHVVVHLAEDLPCIVGAWVTVGHAAILHACIIGDETLIGMGATVLDGAVIGRRCLIGAGSLVTPGTVIPDGSMVLGSPAKVVRELTLEKQEQLKSWAEKYVINGAYCLEHRIEVGAPIRTS